VARYPITTPRLAAVRAAVPVLLAPLVLLALLASGCGGDEEAAPPPEPEPTAHAADFPAARGKTVEDLQADAAEGPILAPSVSLLERGRNRFAFALFDTARKQVAGAQVAVYSARQDGTGVEGPFLARSESLAVKPQFQSRSTAADPDAAKAVYVATVPFEERGRRSVWALVRLDGRMLRTDAHTVKVGTRGAAPPAVGDRAISVSTPTASDVGGDLTQISTRQPPADALHQVDFADALGKRPAVITFATPQLCQSRVCGPVVDIVEQVRAGAPKDVAFIQQEIYAGNDPDNGVREQVARWHLPSEPWTFVVDRNGRITDRFEGAFSPGELQRAVAKVAT
jgi:hypothetical protein